MNWLLPEYIADALPNEAARIERLRRAMLDLFRVHGYELVMPPMNAPISGVMLPSGPNRFSGTQPLAGLVQAVVLVAASAWTTRERDT